jgi:hypothetical protein
LLRAFLSAATASAPELPPEQVVPYSVLGWDRSPANVTDDRRIVVFALSMKITVQIVQPAIRARPQINRDTLVAARAFQAFQI